MPTTVRVFQIRLQVQTTRMARRAANKALNDMERAAKANALRGSFSTGRLAQSVYKSGPMVVGTTVHGSVGSRLHYARAVEGGTGLHGPRARAYNIFPKGAPHVYRFGRKRRPMLKFVWHGRTVYMNQIPGGPGTVGRSHPGQKGKHWLSRAMVSAALRNNFEVFIYDV